jgi:hypothetical protein
MGNERPVRPGQALTPQWCMCVVRALTAIRPKAGVSL